MKWSYEFKPEVVSERFNTYREGKWTRSNGMVKVAKRIAKNEALQVHDIDRYISDDYIVNIALVETKSKYSVGLYANYSKIGVAAYNQYWHYEKNNKSLAQKTFKEVLDRVEKLIEDVEWNEVPACLIQPMVRHAIFDIDPDHKENSNILHYNRFLAEEPTVPDWRVSIYGSRYPTPELNTMEINHFYEHKEVSATVESTVEGRQKTYRMRYDN